MSEHTIYPHGELKPLAENLWMLTGSLPTPIPRNMIVHRLPDESLLVYSGVALDARGMAALDALGPVSRVVVPHPYHLLDAGFYLERYPKAQLVAEPDAVARLRRRIGARADGAVPATALLDASVRARIVPGMKVREIMLDLDISGGRALVFTDAFSVMRPKKPLMRLLSAPGGVGTPRIVRWRQVDDKRAMRAFFRELAAAADDVALLVGCHGKACTEDCAGALEKTARGL